MKIAVYIDNMSIKDVNCSDLTKGNPGIGGTEYSVLLFAQMYKASFPDDEIIIISRADGRLPQVDKQVVEKDLMNVAHRASNEKADILLISSVFNGQPLPTEFFCSIEKERIRTITWGHNYYLSDYCRKLVKCPYIKANVFVGHQQYDRYIDHEIIYKSTYIYNVYPAVEAPYREENDGKTVTYIGSIVPTKGFHLLANAWKTILAQVPNAELHVIGSGKLYDRNSKLGDYGIAEQSYEKSFIQGITDDNGELLPSVHFHGVMGEEKRNLIAKTSVGVPNPSGRTETFGISALDFSARGVPVVTIAVGGFLDTVINEKTGLLYANTDELAKKVIELLEDRDKNERYGKAGIQFAKEFEPQNIIGKWHDLFNMVYRGEKQEIEMPSTFLKNNLKQYRIANRRIKNALHIEYPVSVIGVETIVRNLLRRFGR